MSLKVSGFSSSTAQYKLVSDTDSDENPETDVTGGAGKIYSIEIVNGAGTNTSCGNNRAGHDVGCGSECHRRISVPSWLGFRSVELLDNAATRYVRHHCSELNNRHHSLLLRSSWLYKQRLLRIP